MVWGIYAGNVRKYVKKTISGNAPGCYVLKSSHHACAGTFFQEKKFGGVFMEQGWPPNCHGKM